MFEIPAAKRIKRSELYTSDDFDGEDQDTSQMLINNEFNPEEQSTTTIPNYVFEYEFVEQTTQSAQPLSTSGQEEPEVFAFNLFKPRRPSELIAATLTGVSSGQTDPQDYPQPTNLISLRSPSPPSTAVNGGAFNNIRPNSVYFTSALPEAVQREQKERYAASAISASTVLALSRKPWPGMSVTWRVVQLPAHKRQVVIHRRSAKISQDLTKDEEANQRRQRRPRPSKKRRLLLAARSRHRQILIDETKTKEAHEREKKNQKNRERKLKRRAKERREKAEKASSAMDVDAQSMS